MTDTRQDILNYLREKGAADVNELADRIAGLNQKIKDLEAR